MKYDPAKHHRRSIRLKGYDYSQAGAYFVTICVQGRECRFGEVANDEMHLNEAGQMALAAWEALPQRFPTVELDEFIIMPNHMHVIIVITSDNDVGATTRPAFGGVVVAPDWAGTTRAGTTRAGTRPAPTEEEAATARPTLGAIVGAYKSITTDEYIRGVKHQSWPSFFKRVWQRNYHEHIVRNERELNAIRRYILNNPLKWALDRDNPQNIKHLPPPKTAADYIADVQARSQD